MAKDPMKIKDPAERKEAILSLLLADEDAQRAGKPSLIKPRRRQRELVIAMGEADEELRTDEDYLWSAKRAADDMSLAHERRDNAIRGAARKGASSRKIAEAVGLTHAGVLRIVNYRPEED